jgi:ribonuclease R
MLLAFIENSGGRAGKREIIREFGIAPAQRIKLKQILAELKTDGLVDRGRGRQLLGAGTLPNVTVVEATGVDTDGEVLARPITWDQDQPAPAIYMAPEQRGHPALGPGDRALARLEAQPDGSYTGRIIRRIAAAPKAVLGIFGLEGGQGRIFPTNRRDKGPFAVSGPDAQGAQPGDLVEALILPGRRLGLRQARVTDRLGNASNPKAISLIAIHDHDIPHNFSDAVIAAAEAAVGAPMDKRVDLRSLPLITIDGEDARDFDDAVWGEPDPDPANKGGWHIIVAIADVSWYVRPGSPLDKSAYQRGNSVYFPDRVIPMLPEALSNGWCSLKPREDRPCLAAHLWIGPAGGLHRHRFERAMMRSEARLTYAQVQAAQDGLPDDLTEALRDTVIAPLYGAFAALTRARRQRGTLELDLPERQVVINERGQVTDIRLRARYDSHRVIEEFMITANVAAAETLERMSQPCMYRIHDQPSSDKMDALREVLSGVGIKLAKAQVAKPVVFNRIIKETAGTPHANLVNQLILRSQAQAAYSPENIGHYGLALRRYAHFTSPIRRYSDLLVHRALIRGLKAGGGELESDGSDFIEAGEYISITERHAATAERDTVDRFTAAYLKDRVGACFDARINGVTRFGLFVTFTESGADALVPISTLPNDFYVHDEARHELRGRRTKRAWRLGETVTVRLAEANSVTGGMIAKLDDGEGRAGRTGRHTSRADKSGSNNAARPARGKLAKGKKGKMSKHRA